MSKDKDTFQLVLLYMLNDDIIIGKVDVFDETVIRLKEPMLIDIMINDDYDIGQYKFFPYLDQLRNQDHAASFFTTAIQSCVVPNTHVVRNYLFQTAMIEQIKEEEREEFQLKNKKASETDKQQKTVILH